MKYYIRTLRSNLDNILSSESVSPYCFYLSRGFGYQRFDRLKDDTEEHSLRIDTKLFEDEEDVVYIEIDNEDPQLVGVSVQKNQDSFLINKPFYLYPWNCRILFKGIEDAKSSLFICRSSLTNKMWNFFPTGIAEIGEKLGKLKVKRDKIVSVPVDINDDVKRNRLKGFLFAYYWGYCKSLSPNLARMLQAELRIYGIATVLAGLRSPSAEMLNEVDRQKKVFNQFDPNRALLKKRWDEDVLNKFSSDIDRKLFDYLIGRFGVKKQAMDAFAAEQGFAVSPRLDTGNLAGTNWRVFASQIESYTQQQIDMFVANNSIGAEQKVVVNKERTVQCSQDSIYVRVLNEILRGDSWLTLEKISTRKMEVANELTLFVKAYYEIGGYKWEGSSEQTYMDAMRRNIASSDPFDPNQTSNKELRALAVFVLKGDLMDEMLKYMQVSAVEDYSLVLGLWGAAVGYAGIPKTFMQKAALPQVKANDCFNYTYASLTGLENSTDLNPDSFAKCIEQQVKVSASPNKIMESNSVLAQMRKPPLKLTTEQIGFIEDILLKNNWKIDENGFKKIDQIKGIGKKKLEQLRQVLKPYTMEEKATLLFKDDILTDFTPNEVVRLVTECLPDDEKVKEQIEKDVIWYLNDGYGPKEKLIPGLCDYLKRNKSSYGKRQWVRKLYANVDVDLIDRKLREAYL